jgi:uncharacterized protein (TIGR04255 family)
MKAMPVTSRLHLQKPPVVETALQIQFSDLPHWGTVHHGLYYQLIRERFPKFRHLQELPPVVETFPPHRKRLQFQLSMQQDSGCAQFESESADRLIRVQRNRFAYHWLSKTSHHDVPSYPSYDLNLESCLTEFDLFLSFCGEQSLGEVAPVLCEVMYLNHVRPLEGESLEQMVESIFATRIGSFEMFTLNRTFAKADEGRLYAEINTAFDDGSPFVTFQLTSRLNHTDGSVRQSLDLAHNWLIEVFCNLTNPQVRKDRWIEIG